MSPEVPIPRAPRGAAIWKGVLEMGGPGGRAYHIAILLTLAVGVALRLVGLLLEPSSLWLDEAAWAERLLSLSIFEMPMRPMGFMWLAKQVAVLLGPSEFALRLPLNLASIAVLLAMPYVASRLVASQVLRLLLVALFALHPALIDYANEFKPYSLEVLIHLVPLLLYLKYRETTRRGYLYWMIGLLPVLFFFGYNIVFTFPGILLWGLIEGWKQERYRGAAIAVASGVVCVVALAVTHSLLLNQVQNDESEEYWGEKYDVFYGDKQEDQGKSRAAWFARKYTDMAALPGLRRELWKAPGTNLKPVLRSLTRADRVFWTALNLLGAFYLLRKQREWALLLLLPVLVTLIVNALGIWPLGAFRTNLYLCLYLLIVPVLGMDYAVQRSNRRLWAATGAVAGLTLLPGFAFGFDWRQPKTFWGARHHDQRQIIRVLREWRESELRKNPALPREYLLFDCHTLRSHQFYLRRHPAVSAENGQFFRKNFKAEDNCNTWFMRRTLPRLLRREQLPVWVIVSKPDVIKSFPNFVRKVGKVVSEQRIGDYHLLMRVTKKDDPPETENAAENDDTTADEKDDTTAGDTPDKGDTAAKDDTTAKSEAIPAGNATDKGDATAKGNATKKDD